MDNFCETAKRMHHSSEALHREGHYHNACYLAGYVVECYAKIIIGLSYNFDHTTLAQVFSHNLKEMGKELEYVFGYSSCDSYIIADIRSSLPNIFRGVYKWHPIKRYSSHEWNEQNSLAYQSEIAIAMTQLARMEIDGLTLI